MSDVSIRELRNDISAVLRRVEAGERLRVTASGRPVAMLVPLPHRQTDLSWDEFTTLFDTHRADPGLTAELAALAPDTTDDLP